MSLPKPDTLRRLVDEAAEKAKRFKAVCSDSHDDVSALTDFEDEQPNKKPLIVESSSAESFYHVEPDWLLPETATWLIWPFHFEE